VFDYLEDTNQDGNAYNDDFDGDGIPNFMDPDDDNDKIDTIAEVNLGDTDNDGNLNYLDVDDDGDTWLTIDEGTGDDDKDSVPNYLDNTHYKNPVTGQLFYSNTKYHIGDKNYELSNHLGNVLSVITDKKIISTAFKEEILYQGFKEFKEDGEKTHISVNTSLQCVNTFNGTGTYLPLVLEANTEYNVKTTLVLENYHSAVNIIVEDQLGNNLFFTT